MNWLLLWKPYPILPGASMILGHTQLLKLTTCDAGYSVAGTQDVSDRHGTCEGFGVPSTYISPFSKICQRPKTTNGLVRVAAHDPSPLRYNSVESPLASRMKFK